MRSIRPAAHKPAHRKGRASAASGGTAGARRPVPWERAALALLVVALCLVNALWIAHDTRPQPGPDPNTYLIKTYEFLDRLQEAGSTRSMGLQGLWNSVSEMSIQGRPPLYQLAAVPFLLALGRADDSALWVNTLALAILLVATYGIGSLVWNRRAGLLAALLVGTFPPIVQISKIVRSHAALPACVALSTWLLLLLVRTRSVRVAWWLGLSLALGMWTHLDFAYLMPAPAVIVGVYVAVFQTGPRRPVRVRDAPGWLLAKLREPVVLWGLLPGAACAAALVAAWYLPHLDALRALRQAVESHWSGEAFGFADVAPGFWWYAATAPRVLSSVSALLLAVGLVVCALQRRLGTAVLVVAFLAIYTAFGMRLGDLGWLHFSAALPVAAAIVAVTVVSAGQWLAALGRGIGRLGAAVARGTAGRRRNAGHGYLAYDLAAPTARDAIGRGPGQAGILPSAPIPGYPLASSPSTAPPAAPVARLLAALLLVVCVGTAVYGFCLVAWDGEPALGGSRALARALGVQDSSGIECSVRMNLAFCPYPARAEEWAIGEILRVVLDDPQCTESPCRLVVVPKIMDGFNSVAFEAALASEFAQHRSRVVVSSADGYGGAPSDGEWVTGEYLVVIPEWPGAGGREYRIGMAVTRLLASPPPIFAAAHQEVARFPLPGGWSARLLKRSEPVTTESAIRSYEEAARLVPIDGGVLEKLTGLYLRVEDWPRAEALSRQAIRLSPGSAWPLMGLGYLYGRQGLPGPAAAAYRAAIEKEPHAPEAYRALADLLGAGAALEQGVFALAAEKNPRRAWPQLEWGYACVQAGRLAEAEAAFHRAAAIEPDNPVAQAAARVPFWSLASGLGNFEADGGGTPLVWWQDHAWVRPYPDSPDVLIGPSILPVAGRSRPDQIHFHPFGTGQPTRLRLEVAECGYSALHVGVGLADAAAGLSNGVRFTLQACAEGETACRTLWEGSVQGAGWRSENVSLLPYWRQEVTFQLSADALGDDRYDWLQTTLRLVPAQQVWDLAESLPEVRAEAEPPPGRGSIPGEGALAWNGAGTWTDGAGRPLVSRSISPVQGQAAAQQVLLHPFGPGQETAVILSIPDNPYSALRTAYALADEAIRSGSDGVRYTIGASLDGGRTFRPLLEETVAENRWQWAILDLDSWQGQDVWIRLASSANGSDSFDWLQVTLDLFPPAAVPDYP